MVIETEVISVYPAKLPYPNLDTAFVQLLRQHEVGPSKMGEPELRRDMKKQVDAYTRALFSFAPLSPLPEKEIMLLDLLFRLKNKRKSDMLLESFYNYRLFPNVDSFARGLLDPSRKVTCRDGSRGLEEYLPVGETVEEQLGLRNPPIRVLDIGSGSAKMLHELKLEFGDLVETHALSPKPEPHYPVNYYHCLCGEYMPLEFATKFDVVVSQMAIMYALFPDRILKNAFLALSPTGAALLDVHSYRDPEIPEIERPLQGKAKELGIFLDCETRRKRLGRACKQIGGQGGDCAEKKEYLYEIRRN